MNAGKFYYYVISHPYNRLQALTILLIPAIYVPLLLYIENGYLSTILIPTMLAAIPVALLAMGMANMYGYEHREFLLHKQFPMSFEKQLKERFLGVITVPLFIFYLITIAEIIYLPQLGAVFDIYIATNRIGTARTVHALDREGARLYGGVFNLFCHNVSFW